MKPAVLLLLLLVPVFAAQSQSIADVRHEGSRLVVYDAEGSRLGSMFAGDRQLKGVADSFFVVQDNIHIETYDARCNRLGSMFASGQTVRGAAGSTFTVELHGRIVAYDAQCNRVSSFAAGNSQVIADVRLENGSIVVYNAGGDRISSMFNTGDKRIGGMTGTFFVLQDEYRIETYDAQCNRIESMSATGKTVVRAAGSTFIVDEGSWLVTYDRNCNRVSTQPKR